MTAESMIPQQVSFDVLDNDGVEFADWHAAFKDFRERPDVDWLIEPVLERATYAAMYSKAGEGKSLVALEFAAQLADRGHLVIYLDNENMVRQHVERLTGMGYCADDLDQLKLLSFGCLPPLDTVQGGEALLRLARRTAAVLVVIDTTMRFLSGNEDASDTFNSLYRHTVAPLKAEGITVLRLDHAGKSEDRGQRGSSGKNQAEDYVWKLARAGGSRSMTCEKSRTGHIEAGFTVRLEMKFSPFRHELHYRYDEDGDYGASPNDLSAVTRTAITLDSLEIPVEWGRDRVRTALQQQGLSVANNVLTSAIAERKLSAATLGQVRTGSDRLLMNTCPPFPHPRKGVGTDRFHNPPVRAEKTKILEPLIDTAEGVLLNVREDSR